MERPAHESDTEFEAYVVERVEPGSDGWSLTFDGSMGLYVTKENCAVEPKVGEGILIYGRGFGSPVRGIVIAGRVYRYETPAEHEISQAAMRDRLTREHHERDEAFRAAPKPPLEPFSVNDGEAWLAYVKVQSADPYSYCCVQFASAWANLMETRGELPLLAPTAESDLKVAQIADACSKEADKRFGITGFMYGAAVHTLAKFWKHGEALRRWHNKETQIGDEGDKANESGSVLNPALLSVTVRA